MADARTPHSLALSPSVEPESKTPLPLGESRLGGEGSLIEAIHRLWNVAPDVEDALAEEAYAFLDRATAARRGAEKGGPDWAAARLAEGLSRLYVARQMAAWGNRSYAIQALEAAIDGLRDAVAALPPDFNPSRDDVAAFRAALMVQWRAAQGEAGLDRIAGLSIPHLRTG